MNRLLGKRDCNKIIKKTKLFEDLKNIFGKIFITDEENIGHSNIYWRCVRPHPYNDIGPFHKDKWFGDLGCEKLKKIIRVKIWISLLTDSKKLGFRFVKGSVKKIIDFHPSLDITLQNLFLMIEKLKKDIQSVKGKKGSLIYSMMNYYILES